MKFYVSYSVQPDNFGGAPLSDETFDIYDTEKEFLLELHDYCQFVIDGLGSDSMLECEIEDANNYMAKLEEKMSDPSIQNGLYDEELHSSVTVFSVSLATSDISAFLNHIYDLLLEQYDCDDVWDLEPEDRSDLFEEAPLLKYCAMLIASDRKPDPKTLKRKLDDYMCGCEALYLRMIRD